MNWPREHALSFGDHLEKVRYFQAVCDAGTFRGAALQLRLSQSSLTVAVKKLETSVGSRLLVRTKRGVRLTETGEILLAFARDLSFRVEDVQARLRAPSDVAAGRLRIGAYDSIAIYWLPRVLRHLHRRFPHLSLSVSIGTSASLIERVRSGDLDIAIVVASPVEARLDMDDLFRDRFGIFASSVAAHRQPADARPLIGMFGARVSPQRTLGEILREEGLDLTGALEVESFEIARSLALQGVGMAVLPRRVAAFDGGSRRRLVPVKGLPQGFGEHRINIVTLPDAEARLGLTKVVCREMRRVE